MTDFRNIYDKYFRDVYRYTLSLCKNDSLAQEITQETFFKALGSIDSFDGKCRIFVWLCQIARNTYISMCRKNKHLDFDADINKAQNSTDLETEFADKETAYEVHRCLHRLEEPYKEVFTLRTFGELSFAQIGALFSKTEGWARVTYHRARLKIREELK
ncbi:MAG: RNA polymerase sigma factor [Oscillospiraceae bacterium]|nr:RNA polymerase sigma factor [Oscillospiraceae bacterium]